ncbi:MAG: FAD-dependent oxidoreductase [Acidobacteriota bacterium]
MSDRVVVLGAGMAGLGAVHRLQAEGLVPEVYDKKTYSGGHAASFVRRGSGRYFVFDDGPHISFTQDTRIQDLLADGVDGAYETPHTRVDNLWRGHRLKHPAICNLHGLPTDLVVAVIDDFAAAASRDDGPEPRNYAEWLERAYGRTFAETFPAVYGRKYHTAPAEAMTTDWLGPRLYRPALAEVLRGALDPTTADVHYVSHFRYPTRGGFEAFLRKLVAAARPRLGREMVTVDPKTRRLTFADGAEVPYHQLVSSLPLPELVPRIVGAPQDVRKAASKLACTTCILVDLAIDRDDVSDHHWTYFYDEDLVFTRVSYPHLLSPHNAPEGTSTVQAEVYYSEKYRPLGSVDGLATADDHIEPVIRDLRRAGVLREDDRILLRHASHIPWANIIFDHDRPAALERIFSYLDDVGIATAGRYGRWGYHWTDESFRSGEDAAQSVLDRLGR